MHRTVHLFLNGLTPYRLRCLENILNLLLFLKICYFFLQTIRHFLQLSLLLKTFSFFIYTSWNGIIPSRNLKSTTVSVIVYDEKEIYLRPRHFIFWIIAIANVTLLPSFTVLHALSFTFLIKMHFGSVMLAGVPVKNVSTWHTTTISVLQLGPSPH